jgi:SAM-dependent methyltransferase
VDDLYTLLARVESDSVVLDLGCGRGSFQYEQCRGRIIGMDLTLPEKKVQQTRMAYVRADSSAIPLHDASVDVVLSHHTLEHFTDYKATLMEIRRILSPQGWVWIAVPNGHGFDDALYRFLFAGGGHVNRFAYQQLVDEVESITQTRLVRSCSLFTGFIYLKRPNDAESQYPGKAGFLTEIPAGFLTFAVGALNMCTRLVDKMFATRFSQYGWGFVFARQPMFVDAMPSYFNVCSQCGSGNSAEFLKRSSVRSILGLGLYDCPNCGALNVFVQPPPNLQ